jgi:hypothetical protein
VTGFYAPSNLEKSLVIRRFFHIRPRIHPQNSAMSRNNLIAATGKSSAIKFGLIGEMNGWIAGSAPSYAVDIMHFSSN